MHTRNPAGGLRFGSLSSSHQTSSFQSGLIVAEEERKAGALGCGGGAPSRGSNWHHRCSQKHSSDNTSILSHWATRELQETLVRKAAAKEKDAYQFLLHFIGQSRTQANEAGNAQRRFKTAWTPLRPDLCPPLLSHLLLACSHILQPECHPCCCSNKANPPPPQGWLFHETILISSQQPQSSGSTCFRSVLKGH